MKIISHDDKLFVLDDWHTDFNQPIRYRAAWPTGLDARDYAHFIGQEGEYCSGGMYRLRNGTFLQLEFGAKTQPSDKYTEERKIPCPANKHRYYNGRWIY